MSKVKIIPDLRFPEFENEGDWQKKPLEDVLQFQTGFPFDSEGFNEEGRGVRLIKNRDLKSDDKIVHYSKPYDEKYLVTNGDVLVGMDGDFTPIKWNKGVALLNQRVGRVLTNQKDDELFFLYFLSIHLKAIEEKTARTTVKHLSHSVVEKINEPIPKPKEQQKIASCLSSLDEVIAAHSQKLDLLKDHKKGLMQNLFPQEGEKVPKYRFKEFEKDGEWVDDILFNLAKNGFSNGVFNDPKKVGSGYKLINVINMYTESPICENDLSLLELSQSEFEKNKVEFGDIFFTRSSLVPEGIAKSNIYLGSSDDITYDGHLIRMQPKKELTSPIFLHYLLKTENVRRQMIAKGKTATMTTIGQSDVASVEISYSKNPKEQQKIASCISSLDALITAQAEKIEQLKLHKKGLMQWLFPKINE